MPTSRPSPYRWFSAFVCFTDPYDGTERLADVSRPAVSPEGFRAQVLAEFGPGADLLTAPEPTTSAIDPDVYRWAGGFAPRHQREARRRLMGVEA